MLWLRGILSLLLWLTDKPKLCKSIYGFRDHGKCCIEGKAVSCGWNGSGQGSLTEVKKEEFEIHVINLY